MTWSAEEIDCVLNSYRAVMAADTERLAELRAALATAERERDEARREVERLRGAERPSPIGRQRCNACDGSGMLDPRHSDRFCPACEGDGVLLPATPPAPPPATVALADLVTALGMSSDTDAEKALRGIAVLRQDVEYLRDQGVQATKEAATLTARLADAEDQRDGFLEVLGQVARLVYADPPTADEPTSVAVAVSERLVEKDRAVDGLRARLADADSRELALRTELRTIEQRERVAEQRAIDAGVDLANAHERHADEMNLARARLADAQAATVREVVGEVRAWQARQQAELAALIENEHPGPWFGKEFRILGAGQIIAHLVARWPAAAETDGKEDANG